MGVYDEHSIESILDESVRDLITVALSTYRERGASEVLVQDVIDDLERAKVGIDEVIRRLRAGGHDATDIR